MQGSVALPGSKSVSNRTLLLAALVLAGMDRRGRPPVRADSGKAQARAFALLNPSKS